MDRYRHHRDDYPNEPITVHCSAGVGRSGTFLAIDTILDNIVKAQQDSQENKDEGNPTLDVDINVHKVVEDLRKQRPKSVQSYQQYAFIHEFVSYCHENELFGIETIKLR